MTSQIPNTEDIGLTPIHEYDELIFRTFPWLYTYIPQVSEETDKKDKWTQVIPWTQAYVEENNTDSNTSDVLRLASFIASQAERQGVVPKGFQTNFAIDIINGLESLKNIHNMGMNLLAILNEIEYQSDASANIRYKVIPSTDIALNEAEINRLFELANVLNLNGYIPNIQFRHNDYIDPAVRLINKGIIVPIVNDDNCAIGFEIATFNDLRLIYTPDDKSAFTQFLNKLDPKIANPLKRAGVNSMQVLLILAQVEYKGKPLLELVPNIGGARMNAIIKTIHDDTTCQIIYKEI